ncbi:MAG TPA: hypothetical protein HA355_03745 [Methanosphaera sp.]|nr:hypothetical protein [Methanosphaera sp.]
MMDLYDVIIDGKELKYVFLPNIEGLREGMEDPMIDPNLFGDSFVNSYFPVLKGTKFGQEGYMIENKDYIFYLLETYNDNCSYLLERNLFKEMFKQHSLYLLKESLKTFSPYSEKAKELLKKLEELE